ncbi:MAG: RNA 2',3'-cyclic phosphodiesterase [Gemmatimonadaceae bacterium]
MRLFLAINLPDEVRIAIGKAVEPLRAAAPSVAWIGAERLHLTLKFLGEQPEAMLGALGSVVHAVARRSPAIELELGGIGAFPRLLRPRVIWLGIAPEPRLELLHRDVESGCAELGIPVDGRPFRPHVTLGRVRSRLHTDAARELSRAARRVRYGASVPVASVELMQSAPRPGGPHYSVVASAMLRAA